MTDYKQFYHNEYHSCTINFNYGCNFSESLSTCPDLVKKGKVHSSKLECLKEMNELLENIKNIIIMDDKSSFYNLFTIDKNQQFLFKKYFENITHCDDIEYELKNYFEYLQSITIEYISYREPEPHYKLTYISQKINCFKAVIEINLVESCIEIDNEITHIIKNENTIIETIIYGIEYILNNEISRIKEIYEKICQEPNEVMVEPWYKDETITIM